MTPRRARWPILAVPASLHFFAYLTGLAARARLYPSDAYRAVFGLGLAVAVGAAGAARLVTEARCRNVWTPAR